MDGKRSDVEALRRGFGRWFGSRDIPSEQEGRLADQRIHLARLDWEGGWMRGLVRVYRKGGSRSALM